MEPPVAGGAHAGAGGLALVPRHALGHVGHAAVHCHLVQLGLQAVDVLLAGLQGLHGDVDGGEEGGHVNIHWEGDDGPATLSIILISESLEECWSSSVQILH